MPIVGLSWSDIKGEAHHSWFEEKYKVLAPLCSLLEFCWVLRALLYWWQWAGRLPPETSSASRAIQGDSNENKPCPEWTETLPKQRSVRMLELDCYGEDFVPRLRAGSHGASSYQNGGHVCGGLERNLWMDELEKFLVEGSIVII